MKKAKRFVELLAAQLKDQGTQYSNKDTISEAFKDVVKGLPDSKLKRELETEFDKYVILLSGEIAKTKLENGHAKVDDTELEDIQNVETTESKASLGECAYNLYLKKGYKVNKTASGSVNGSQKKAIYLTLLAKRLPKCKKDKTLFQLASCETLHTDSSGKFLWLEHFNKILTSSVGQVTPCILQRIMMLFVQKMLPSIEECLANPKYKGLKKLKKGLFKFLYWCHFKYHQLDEKLNTKPSFEDMLSCMLSWYIDLVAVESRTVDQETDPGKHIAMVTKFLLRQSPNHCYDVVAQLDAVKEQDKDVIWPLLRVILKRHPEPLNHETYTTYMLAVRNVMSHFTEKDSQIFKETALTCPAPEEYLDFLSVKDSAILEDLPVTKKFNGIAITHFLINEAGDELMSHISEVVTVDITEEEAEVQESEKEAEGGEIEQPLFYLDVQGNKKMEVEGEQHAGDEQGEEIVITDADIDKMLQENEEEEEDSGSVRSDVENIEDEDEAGETVADTINTIKTMLGLKKTDNITITAGTLVKEKDTSDALGQVKNETAMEHDNGSKGVDDENDESSVESVTVDDSDSDVSMEDASDQSNQEGEEDTSRVNDDKEECRVTEGQDGRNDKNVPVETDNLQDKELELNKLEDVQVINLENIDFTQMTNNAADKMPVNRRKSLRTRTPVVTLTRMDTRSTSKSMENNKLATSSFSQRKADSFGVPYRSPPGKNAVVPDSDSDVSISKNLSLDLSRHLKPTQSSTNVQSDLSGTAQEAESPVITVQGQEYESAIMDDKETEIETIAKKEKLQSQKKKCADTPKKVANTPTTKARKLDTSKVSVSKSASKKTPRKRKLGVQKDIFEYSSESDSPVKVLKGAQLKNRGQPPILAALPEAAIVLKSLRSRTISEMSTGTEDNCILPVSSKTAKFETSRSLRSRNLSESSVITGARELTVLKEKSKSVGDEDTVTKTPTRKPSRLGVQKTSRSSAKPPAESESSKRRYSLRGK